MIILDATTKTLEAVLAGAVTLNQLAYTVHYCDITTTAFTPGEVDGLTNSTTAVTILSAPAASTQRQVKTISVHNRDTAAATVTVSLDTSGTERILVKAALAVDSTLIYTDGEGWKVIDSSGGILTSTAAGSGAITALTGDVTATGPGSVAATIANNSVTYAKLQDVSATDRLLGRDTAGAGDTEELTVTGGVEFTGSGGIQRSALTGDVTAAAGSNATTIANDAVTTAKIINDAVTYAKIQNVSATDRLLGRDTAAAGDVEELTVGGGVEFTGTGGIQRSALTGDVTATAGSNATTIANDAVTFAKMQNIATDRLLGRETAGSGDPEEIALGGGLEMGSTTLRQCVVFFLNAGPVAGHSPADSTTYRFGPQPGINPGTTSSAYAAFATRGGTIKRAYGNFVVAGTLASAENVTVRVRNETAATTEAVTSTLQMTAVSNPFNNTAMTLAFSAGDNIACEFVTPAWATNPTVVFYNLTIELQYT